jgi:hypothetical protein
VFDDCFPGRIGMSDVDGVVEQSGRFLFLEWKSHGASLTTGQRIMFEQLTSLSPDPLKVVVMVIGGDPELMTVETLQVFHSGKSQSVASIDLDGLKERIRKWSERTAACKIRPSKRAAA